MATLTKEIQDVINNTSDVLFREEIYINDVHEYDYHKLHATKDATVHTLYFSNDASWDGNINNTVAMQLVDNGNGIEIIGVNSKKTIEYLEAEQLHILLRLSSGHSVYQITPQPIKKEF